MQRRDFKISATNTTLYHPYTAPATRNARQLRRKRGGVDVIEPSGEVETEETEDNEEETNRKGERGHK